MADARLPIDESVAIPESVKRAAAAAAAAHQAVYGGETPPADEPKPEPAPVTETAAPEPEPAPAPEPPKPPPPVELSKPEDRHGVDSTSWEGKYYAMEGRFRQAQGSMGQMQQQMAELADELARTTAALNARTQAPEPVQQAKYVTDADVQTYGHELLDTIKRAALEAVHPEIQQVTQQTRQANQRIAQTAQAAMYQQLDAQFPQWREINQNPRFKTWCNLPDVYSGQLRVNLLNAAVRAANAPRAIAFFKGFQNEEVATGNAPSAQPEPSVAPVPREAAVQIGTLTAPGRAKPATGDSVVSSADKPFITHAQIKSFYDDVRRGTYVGRDDERKALENRIFAAQREGRIR